MKNRQKHIDEYFNKISTIARLINKEKINKLVLEILNLKKKKGRLFKYARTNF